MLALGDLVPLATLSLEQQPEAAADETDLGLARDRRPWGSHPDGLLHGATNDVEALLRVVAALGEDFFAVVAILAVFVHVPAGRQVGER